MKSGHVELIDNSRNQPDFSLKYKNVPSTVVKFFVKYLEEVGHPKAAAFMKAEIKRKEMKWTTKDNGVDCGVFLMRHMETYKGKENWDCGLEVEGRKQQTQLKNMRIKYGVKMLCHEKNLLKDKVMEGFEGFEKKYDEKTKNKLQNEAAKKAGEEIRKWIFG